LYWLCIGFNHLSISPSNRAAFFASANSRRGAEWFGPANEALKERGIDIADARLFESVEELADAVRGTGAPLVIVGGGDGTLSAVAPHFENTARTLGVMPFGTGNAFAKDLSIPIDIDKAAGVIAGGHIALVDVGVANNKRFLNVATLGVTTLIARELDSGVKRISATVAYGFAMYRALLKAKEFDAELTIDGETHSFKTLQIVVGNGRLHAGALLVDEDASLDAGTLQVYALTNSNKMALLRMALRARNGTQGDLEDVLSFSAKSLHLETKPSRQVTLDGEIATKTPVNFSVIPRAIKVAVPENWNSHKS
jgi:YegS/Rv2252/BmrU family lipid kinase